VTLAALLVSHVAPERRPSPSAKLERALEALVRSGRAAWPGVRLADADFVRHVATRLGAGDTIAALGALRAGDLYLACGCALGDANALAAFEAELIAPLRPFLASRGEPADVVEETLQTLRTRLLTRNGERLPRIGGYLGRGSLSGWVRRAAGRVAADLRAVEKGRREVGDDALEAWAADGDQEMSYLRQRHAEDLRDAFTSTLAALEPREANALRLYFLEDLTVEAIARLYRVNERTVRRWLGDIRERVLAETKRRLAERGQLSSSQITGIIDALRGDLDVTLVRVLGGAEKHDG
jgi:RNA polymerase sigma-70 factor (ECF subfamily)